ncbi:unnamed protein product [Caenorhabditis angaria]|uniref:SUN domain-containing protein n=1 Tax=Caenorhabditis angaria TaxID=860376 RepID=A0A9P1IY65_9PELO|nr:unnamed protein product [Caenorhabditis angaria]
MRIFAIFWFFIIFLCIRNANCETDTGVMADTEAVEEGKMCPRCMDFKYKQFGFYNPQFVNGQHRQYLIHPVAAEYPCWQFNHTMVKCEHACLRMRLESRENGVYEDIGFAYDCSTDVIHKTPTYPWDITKLDDDLRLIDILNYSGDIRVLFEITFYKYASQVETFKMYTERVYQENKLRLDREYCREHPTKCEIKKLLAHPVAMFFLIFTFTLLFTVGVTHCCCVPKTVEGARFSFARYGGRGQFHTSSTQTEETIPTLSNHLVTV